MLPGKICSLSVYANAHDAAPRVTLSTGLKGDKSAKSDLHADDNLAATIKGLEKDMREAATNLEF